MTVFVEHLDTAFGQEFLHVAVVIVKRRYSQVSA
jgi:hypothetical protein